MAGILDVRWAHNGTATVGPYYTAQGIIQQIGQLGVTLITFVCFPCIWLLRTLTYD
jgi:aconitase A